VNQDSALSSGDLAPGGEIEGTIPFEQPKDDPALVLQYTGNLFKSDSEIDFKLN
jgi:Telomeric repeat-binding factor 2.